MDEIVNKWDAQKEEYYEKTGITRPDQIVAVDGTPSTQLSGWDFRRATRLPANTKLTLSIVREGQPRTVVLILKELLP